MNEKSPARPWALSRRELLGAAGAAAATVLLPLSSAAAAPAALSAVKGARIASLADDAWGLYPRYAEPIAFAKPRAATLPVVEPLEAL